MSDPEIPLEELIALAAEKRVAGEKWQAVADAVKRGLRTVQGWPKGSAIPLIIIVRSF